jgi:large subunit ribosomal protein L17
MRHKVQGRKFGRTCKKRNLMLRNLATSLILYEKVETTEAKAKEVKRMVDRLISRGKAKDLTARRYLGKYLLHKNAVEKILRELADKYASRPSGFSRIMHLGNRAGDSAPLVRMELV